jgi:hypothetical protein
MNNVNINVGFIDTEIEYYCEKCNVKCNKKSDFDRHIKTIKHQNQSKSYICECGNTYKHRQSLFNHKKKCKHVENENEKKNEKDSFICNCGKEYKHRQSLFNHKQICNIALANDVSNNIYEEINNTQKNINKVFQEKPQIITNEMIFNMLEKNQELQNQIIELSKQNKVVNNTTNNTMHTNFNLNVFLNENCKDALNIADFVESLKLTVQDLKETGKLGFTQGISRIFVNALRKLDVNMRPLHCTDIKRETIYIKDQNIWEKENAEKTKIRRALQQISKKNLRILPIWQKENPNHRFIDTPENEEFIQISLHSLGPDTNEEQERQEDKIIRNVLREVIIDKTTKIGM